MGMPGGEISGVQRAVGEIAQDNRRFINGMFWILRTGRPWRNLPLVYGDWKNTHLAVLPLAG